MVKQLALNTIVILDVLLVIRLQSLKEMTFQVHFTQQLFYNVALQATAMFILTLVVMETEMVKEMKMINKMDQQRKRNHI